MRLLTILGCCLLAGSAFARDTAQTPSPEMANPATPPAPGSAIQPPANPATGDHGSSDSDHTDTDRADTDRADTDHDSGDWDSADTKPSHRHRHHRSNGNDVVALGHNVELREGQRADSVVAIFGSAKTAGDVEDSVVAVLGNVRVTGTVRDTAVAVLGGVYINGKVDGDVVGVMGNVELGPEAVIGGNVVVVGGELTRDPKAVVHGDVETVFTGTLGDFDWIRPWIERCLLYGRPLAFGSGLGWAWGLALGFLALYVFLAFLFRDGVERCVHTLETYPGHSILAALLTVLLTPVAIVLLLITVLGIAAIPFLALALLCGTVFGKAVVLAAIGRRIVPASSANAATHTVLSVLVGSVIVLLLYTIPVVGYILYQLLQVLGLGVVVYTLLLLIRGARQARGTGANGQGGSTGAGTTAYSSSAAAGPAGVDPAAGGAARAGVFSAGIATPPPGTGESGEPSMSATTASVDPSVGAGGADAASSAGGNVPPGAGTSAGPGGGIPPGAAGGGGAPPGAAATAPPGAGAAPPASIDRTSLPRAGFWIRMGALALDTILVSVVFHETRGGGDISLVALAAYGAVMWKLKSATIGGIICGLQVVRLDRREIDWATAVVRALGCFLSLAVVGLGFIWIAVDKDRQAWHDKIAGTVVVRAPKGSSLL